MIGLIFIPIGFGRGDLFGLQGGPIESLEENVFFNGVEELLSVGGVLVQQALLERCLP